MFLMGDPDEIRRQQEQAEMQEDVLKHDVERFFDSLDKEQLLALRLIMRTTHNEGYAEYIAGFIAGILKHKYRVCGCGRDHEAEAMAALTGEPVVAKPDVTRLPEEAVVSREEMLETYNLRDADQTDVERGLTYDPTTEQPVFCKGCGLLYQSLEDRMHREPGVAGCHGCQHKSAWG